MAIIFDTPEYWEGLARDERSFAADERKSRYGTVESIRVHLENAKDYEARAKKLREAKA
jgi:hypothetical protein